VRLPRDLSGSELASLLRRFGYEPVRQAGSHIRLTSTFKETQHHITIPAHKTLRVGTLSAILKQVAAYVEVDPDELSDQLFK
jgi:predicted RNA binding protein YcfA (HicA-like mRNA interferase family)